VKHEAGRKPIAPLRKIVATEGHPVIHDGEGLMNWYRQKPENPDYVPTLPDSFDPPRYFIGRDQSSHEYLVPYDKLEEWRAWTEIPEDDERSWDVPKYAKELDGGLLTFLAPEIK
jgi:hypothetical protein